MHFLHLAKTSQEAPQQSTQLLLDGNLLLELDHYRDWNLLLNQTIIFVIMN